MHSMTVQIISFITVQLCAAQLKRPYLCYTGGTENNEDSLKLV